MLHCVMQLSKTLKPPDNIDNWMLKLINMATWTEIADGEATSCKILELLPGAGRGGKGGAGA